MGVQHPNVGRDCSGFIARRMATTLGAALVACTGAARHSPPLRADGGRDAADGGLLIGGPLSVTDVAAAIRTIDCDELVCQEVLAPSMLVDCSFWLKADSYWIPAPPPYEVSAGAGRLAVDQIKAQACLDAVAALDPTKCWGVDGSTKAVDDAKVLCESAFVGLVLTGGACYYTKECANGWCDSWDGSCPAKCVPLKQAGDLCQGDEECGSGLVCRNGMCQSPPPAGEKGASCDPADPCVAGLRCTINGKCDDSPAPNGTPCRDNSACAAGSYCHRDPSGLVQDTCEPRAALGQPCDPRQELLSGVCEGRTVCVGTAVFCGGDTSCQKPGICATFSDVGGTCDPTQTVTGCFSDLVCDPKTSTCVGPSGLGELEGADGCEPDLISDEKYPSHCVEPFAVGVRCQGWIPSSVGVESRENPCASGLFCNDAGVCAPESEEGDDCQNARCTDDCYCNELLDQPTTYQCILYQGCKPQGEP